MSIPFPLGVLLLIAVLTLVHAERKAQNVCIVGFVMDSYCINRGRLLDNPTLDTLQFPRNHSLHCLVDVPACYLSGMEVLLPEPNEEGQHCRAYTLHPDLSKVLDHAREIGSKDHCSTCTANFTGLERGYMATLIGTVQDPDQPRPVLRVTQLLPPEVGCQDYGNVTLPKNMVCTSGKWQPYMVTHGTLMLVSWGFLLPLGVISAKLLKHRPNALWFKLHKALQISGLTLATIGWIVALANFDVFSPGLGPSYIHGLCGMVTMTLGLLQPVNAFFRPHIEPDQEKTTRRICWEYLHKISGYTATTLSVFTILLGTQRIARTEDQRVFLIIYLVVLVSLFGVAMACIKDRRSHAPRSKLSEGLMDE